MSKKPSILKDMRIEEVSLVFNPASPGADILFTKHRDIVRKFDPNQPRDDHGRWVDIGREAVRGAGRRLNQEAKSLAVAAIEHSRSIGSAAYHRAREGGGRGAAHIVSAIVSTRPTDVVPVRGGGVQFNFKHTLADKSVVNSSVQIRPEHLGAEKPVEGQGFSMTGETQENPTRQGLAVFHRFLLRNPDKKEVEPFYGKTFSYTRTEPQKVADKAHDAEVDRLRREKREIDEKAAARQGIPYDEYRRRLTGNTSGSGGGGGGNGQQSNEAGVTSRGSDQFPLYEPPANEQSLPNWVRRQTRANQARDSQHFNAEVPRRDSTYNDANWRSYMLGEDLVPSARPDLQAYAHKVYEWARSARDRQRTAEEAYDKSPNTSSPETSRGKGYFMRPIEIDGRTILRFVPPGTVDFQRGIEGQYQRFQKREEALSLERSRAAANGQPAPQSASQSSGGNGAPRALPSGHSAGPSSPYNFHLSPRDMDTALDHLFSYDALSGKALELRNRLDTAIGGKAPELGMSREELRILTDSIGRTPERDRSVDLQTLQDRIGDHLDNPLYKSLTPSLFEKRLTLFEQPVRLTLFEEQRSLFAA